MEYWVAAIEVGDSIFIGIAPCFDHAIAEARERAAGTSAAQMLQVRATTVLPDYSGLWCTGVGRANGKLVDASLVGPDADEQATVDAAKADLGRFRAIVRRLYPDAELTWLTAQTREG